MKRISRFSKSKKTMTAFLFGAFLMSGLSAFAYTDLEWKFVGDTARVAKSQNDGALASALDTFVSSARASAPLDWFSSFPRGLMLLFK